MFLKQKVFVFVLIAYVLIKKTSKNINLQITFNAIYLQQACWWQ
jgi:hypothetical protein